MFRLSVGREVVQINIDMFPTHGKFPLHSLFHLMTYSRLTVGGYDRCQETAGLRVHAARAQDSG